MSLYKSAAEKGYDKANQALERLSGSDTGVKAGAKVAQAGQNESEDIEKKEN